MSAQDKTEQVLRDIHILFSRSEIYDKSSNKVIVDKKAFLELLNRLNVCIYDIMEEHELTQQSRDKAEREAKKRGDEIIWDASRKAEDVYAASIMYTDEALRRIQEIVQTATDSVKDVYERMDGELKKEKAIVQGDQSDLKGHLQDLADTGKYLQLIEDRNKEIEREKLKKKEPKEKEAPSSYATVKPEIKINTEYFEKAGISLEPKETAEAQKEEFSDDGISDVEIHVDLDAEYFDWKEDEQGESEKDKKAEKHSFFGKLLKGDTAPKG